MKKIKEFSKKCFYAFPDLRKWVPQPVKNFSQNTSYRYLSGGGKIAENVLNLFKMYVKVAQNTVSDLNSLVSTGGKLSINAALGGPGAFFGSAVSSLASYAMNASNPLLSMVNVAQSLGALDTIARTFLYAFQMSQNSFVNVVSDLGRSLFTKEKVFQNLLKSPEVYKSIVDGYVFEKFFKVFMNALIGIFLIHHLTTQYSGEHSNEYIQAFQNLGEAIKEVGVALPGVLLEFTKGGKWTDKAHFLYKALFNNEVALKKFQKSVLLLQNALLQTAQKMVDLGSQNWSSGKYEAVKVVSSWIKTGLSNLSVATNFQSKKLDVEIVINKTLRDAPKNLKDIMSWGFELGKSLFYKNK
ncbi:hypothetical protein HE1_00851 [Holospora elegans E1]|uniref:Uncharacterized protein n=1 Tax=Holospora elegans E1 TaxID=1427503 RepID=A0A023DYI5_9PROT|nr:hypothetical protein [Holospora elegans]GAJ46516.1 hypothetical protein HE1_00851 [Holospora elegans E1]